LNDEIASSKELLKSYTNSCERKRHEAENLNNEISRLEALVRRFKDNNEEYIKIKKTVEEEVNKLLTDGKALLQFAVASVFKSIRRNPEEYNNLLGYDLPSSGSLLYIEGYKDMILDESKELYDKLLKHFTDSIMDNTVDPVIHPTPN